MGEAIKGLTRQSVVELADRFQKMLTSPEDTDDSEGSPPEPGSVMGELDALQGVRRYPVRIKCASLPWTTLVQAVS